MASARGSVAGGVIRELDGLRGVAILMVMLHRFWPRTGVGADIAGAGWIGVDLFFVISGFLITGILLDTRRDDGYFRNFYARRALRIFPLFYVFVIGCFVAFWGNPEFRERAGSPLWYVLHLGNVPEGLLGNDVPYWLAPMWSLAIEEQFYLTFPWLVYFLDRRRLTVVLIAMIVLAPVLRCVTMLAAPDHERVQYLFTACRLDTLAAGCLLAVVARQVDVARWRTRTALLAVVAVPAVVALAIASRLDRTSPFDRVFGYSVVAAGSAYLVALVVVYRGRAATALLRQGALTYLGKLCFGLYVLHRPADTLVSTAAARAGVEGDLWLLPVKVVVAVVLATVSWRVLEAPFLALKGRFATSRHPSAAPAAAGRPIGRGGLVHRALRWLGVSSLVACALGCEPNGGAQRDAPDVIADLDGSLALDAAPPDAAPPDAAPPDAAPPDAAPPDAGTQDAVPLDATVPDAGVPTGVVLYPEGPVHSPIPPALVARLQAIAASHPHDPRVVAKLGDSITASPSFLRCFATGPVDLGAHADLAATIAYVGAGDAAGSSPFARASLAAVGGAQAADLLAGAPCLVDQELDAIDPQLAVVLFGTNEVRTGVAVEVFGANLWTLIDRLLGRGVIPVMSTLPANLGDPGADAQIPTFNRVVRALAQGRGVPLVDLHRALAPLPDHGISSDHLHPSVAPQGACILTTAGLQFGYDVRNLVTLQALARVHAALTGVATTPVALTRGGAGSVAAPFAATLPLVDLADTRGGEAAAAVAAMTACGVAPSGHARVYRVDVAAATLVHAYTVVRGDVPPADVEVYLADAAHGCRAAGTSRAVATLGPGAAHIVVAGRTTATDGEYLLVVE